jgi:hypothetical protein
MAIKVNELTPDHSAVVGIAICANDQIVDSTPAAITDGVGKMQVPLIFFKGELNAVRTEMHKLVDEAIDNLMYPQDMKYY